MDIKRTYTLDMSDKWKLKISNAKKPGSDPPEEGVDIMLHWGDNFEPTHGIWVSKDLWEEIKRGT
jgi:hypothetical protein